MHPLNFALCEYTNEPAIKLQEINHICLKQYGLENVFSVSDLEDVQKYYCQNGGVFLLVKLGEDIIGYGAIDNLYEGVVGSLTRLRILPEYQRRGIGAALVKELLKKARANKYQRLFLDTSTTQDAHSLYEKFGFTEFFRKTGQAGVTDVYYELKLV